MGLSAQCLEKEVLRLPWRAVLSQPLVVAPQLANRPLHSALAAVPFLGLWSGWLTLRCDLRLSHEIASRLRGDELVCAAEVDNATRWLAGVVASALQPVIDAEARLGPATILDALEPWTPRWCRPAARLLFSSADRMLGIALDERMPLALRQTGLFESDLDDTGAPHDEIIGVEPQSALPDPISKRRTS